MKKLALLLLLAGCASNQNPFVGWTVDEPQIERDGSRRVLTVVAEACEDDAEKLTCNVALSRARALLGRRLRGLLEEIGAPASDKRIAESERSLSLGSHRNVWIERAVSTVEPAEIWRSEADDCVWVLARLDLDQLVSDPNRPRVAGRNLENHLASGVFPAALPAAGGTCE